MLKIVSHTTKDPVKREYLRDCLNRLDFDYELAFVEPGDNPAEVIRGAEVLLSYGFDPEWLSSCDSLRWVHIGGAGIDHISFPELIKSDIIVTNSRGIHRQAIAEYTLAVMLHFSQKLAYAEEWKRHRNWMLAKRPMTRQSFMLKGKRAGIVGGGSIGTAVRDMCMKMEMGLFVIHRKRRSREAPWRVRNGDMNDLDELMKRSDFVIITLPLTAETRGCINRRRIGLMKNTAVLINVSRGGIIDEIALIEALQEGRIGGACLDVFNEEPLPEDSPLFDTPNLFITPHISGNYPEYTLDVIRLFIDNMERYIAKKPLKNVIDWQRGY